MPRDCQTGAQALSTAGITSGAGPGDADLLAGKGHENLIRSQRVRATFQAT